MNCPLCSTKASFSPMFGGCRPPISAREYFLHHVLCNDYNPVTQAIFFCYAVWPYQKGIVAVHLANTAMKEHSTYPTQVRSTQTTCTCTMKMG